MTPRADVRGSVHSGVHSGGGWLVVHDLHDTAAAALAGALQARALSVTTLMVCARWQLCVDSDGSRCELHLAGQRLQPAGVIYRCAPVALHPAVPQADYKSAEWQALLQAWLHGLPCPVINRPRCGSLDIATRSAARWRQSAALGGLLVWPLAPTDKPGWADGGQPGLLVVGDACFALAGAAPPPAAQAAAAIRAAALAGCDLLAWTGAPDAKQRWRVAGATPTPDLRAFDAAAVSAVARLLGRHSQAALCA